MKLKGWVHSERSRGVLLSLFFRKPLVFVIFALLIFGVFFSTFYFIPSLKKAHAIGNTYYVRADGTATKVNAVGPTTDSTVCMSMATFNSSTFSAGDTIYFSDKGATPYSTGMVPPSSGTSGKVITYANAPGESPTIITSAGGTGINISKSYIVVTGFSAGQAVVGNGTGVSIGSTTNVTLSYITIPASHYGVIINGVSPNTIILDHITVVNADYGNDVYDYATLTTGLTISNSTFARIIQINNSVAGLSVSSTSATGLLASAGVTGVLNINGLTINNGVSYGLYLAGTSTLSPGSIIQNSSVSNNSNHQGYQFVGVTGPLTLLNNTSASNSSALGITNSSGITITNFTASNGPTNTSGTDVQVNGSNNLTFNNLNLTGNDLGSGGLANGGSSYNITYNGGSVSHYGYGVTNHGGAHNIAYNNFTVAYIQNLGFLDDDNTGTIHDITYTNCVVHDAGLYVKTHVVSEANDGGWAVHFNAYNMYLYNCIAYNNGGIGIGYGNTSSGAIYNSIEYNNGGNWTSTGGIDTARSGFYDFQTGANSVTGTGWTIKNSIGMGSYPVEIHGGNAGFSYNTIDYNLYYPLNANNFQNFGGTVSSWTTYHTTNGYEPNSVNANPLFTDPSNGDFTLQSLSPAIDAGIDVGLTTDYLNHAIYGAPDIGAYEYQPPEVIGTNEIDIGAGARIYQDGSFRNLSTASGTTANLTITPQSGSFTVGNHALWMDIVIVVWNNTGIYHKSWTETSTVDGLNNTVHKVGDLAPNKYYNVKVDNVLGANMTGNYCTAGLCLADNNGIITFTYTGGYSTHTFDIESEPATVASSGSSNSSTPTTSSTPVAKFPETGIPPSHNNIPRNIFTLSGLLALVLASLIVVLRKRRKYSI